MSSNDDNKKRVAEEPAAEQSSKQQKQSKEDTVGKAEVAERRTIVGGCHCGFIRYAFDTTTLPLKANRCNCTFCQKCHTTNYAVEEGTKNFHLISPNSRDDSGLGKYAPRVKTAYRYFCKECGVHVWMEGYYEYDGHKIDLMMINLATVDQPQDDVDLSETKIQYYDGLNDNFGAGHRDRPWPNGLL